MIIESKWEKKYRHKKHTAERSGKYFSLSLEEYIGLFSNLEIGCPICLVQFVNEENHRSTPSVDRIDMTKGYIPENCQIICRACNSKKDTALTSEIEKINNGFK